jgi:DNA helicase-2/ATP-dependent DNA helicase PcrA
MGVSAVPGSGKTITIAVLAAELIAQGLPEGGRVLVVTYQNSAVDNLRARIAAELKARAFLQIGYDVRTLHSLAYGIIEANPGLAGTTTDFNVLDDRAKRTLLTKAVRIWNNQNRHVWERLLPEGSDGEYWRRRWPDIAQGVANKVITTAKNQRLSPASLQAEIRSARQDSTNLFLYVGAEVYQLYQQQVETIGGLDFDDLVWMAVDLLEYHPDLTARLRQRWPYVLEDEAQDSVPLQEELLSMLVGEDGNWVRVGDPNQAIMSTFTAADPEYLRQFLEREDVQTLTLPESGRSALCIIDLANHLVEWTCQEHPLPEVRRGAFRLQKIKQTGPEDPQQNPPDEQSRIAFRAHRTQEQELIDVARRAKRFADVHPDMTLSVLVPTNRVGYKMAGYLRDIGAEFDEILQSTTSSRQVAEVLGSVIDYLADPLKAARLEGAYAGLREVIPDELDTGDSETVAILLRSCYRPETLLFPAPDARPEDGLPEVPNVRPGDIHAVNALAAHLRRWLRATALPIDQLVMTIAQDIFADAKLATAQKIAAYLRGQAEQNPDWRLPNLARELDLVARGRLRFTGLADEDYGFEPKPGVITLTTMHRAKGLEWDLVYLVGVDGNWFPYTLEDRFIGEYDFLAGDPSEEAQASLVSLVGEVELHGLSATEAAHIEIIAERLRLLYVGITRARRYLSVSWSGEVQVSNQTRPVPLAETYRELKHYYRGSYCDV